MSFYDKASLVLIPSGTKEGTVFSQKPTNGDGDFTFTRASSATRVNSDGLIEKERGNTAEHSNTFNNWSNKNYASLTSGQTGYDGSSDAWLIEANSTIFCYIADTPTINTGIRTRSVYAKQGTSSNLTLLWNSYGNNVFASFDLSNGTFTNSNCLANIEDVGGGWYRCISTITNASNVYTCLISVSDENAGTTAIGDNIYIQDFQQEQGLVATDYIETTTTAVYGGITDNIPRLDYTDASCPSLLLEPQRTNLLPHSEYFGDWILQTNVNLTYNATQSPEGVNNAIKYNITNNTQRAVDYNILLSSGNTYTFSLYVKPIVDTTIRIRDGIGWIEEIEVLAANGWQRIESTYSVLSDAYYIGFFDVSGDDGDRFYFYGAQLEQSSYATSYIPTYGASVTRVNDFCIKSGATDLIGQTEGTLFLDLNVTTTDPNSFLFGLYGSGNEIYFRSVGLNNIRFVHYFGGSLASIITSTLSEGRHKLAACYKNNDWVLYLDGVLVGSDTSGTFSGGAISSISFGYTVGSIYQAFESVNKALLFKTRLSNEELADLTTI